MATHDYVIDNSTGANVRADLNLVLQAILSNNSSSSAPSTTAAYMWWADTTNGILKIRNSANNAWVELLQLDGTLTLENGSASSPALAFRDDLNTGIFSSSNDVLNFSAAGTERLHLAAGTCVFNEDGADTDLRIEGDTEANLFYVNAGNESIGIGSSLANSGRLHVTHSTGTIGYFESTQASSNVANIVGNSTQTNSSSNLILQVNSGTTAQGIIRLNGDNSIGIHNGATPTEKLRIDSSGRLLLGKTSSTDVFKQGNFQLRGTSSDTASIIVESTESGSDGPNVILGHSRGGASVGSGDVLGDVTFTGHDGSDFESRGAIIRAKISATPGGNDMPTHLQFFTCQDGGANLTMGMQVSEDSTCLAAKAFVGKKTNDANVNTSTSSGFTADAFNVVLGQDVLEAQSSYLISFFWNHQGSGQPFESYGTFLFFPGQGNPGSSGAMGSSFVPVQSAHTEQGVSKFWTFRVYQTTGQHVQGLQAAFNQSLNDANGNGQITVMAMKLSDSTTI